ncbi:hypothetical protein EDB83DRAFT_2343296 [Lactarius deliciosus]|nr:hypothetical protein EDB83DRAFT_2343296 [Lactarius deliciosus]
MRVTTSATRSLSQYRGFARSIAARNPGTRAASTVPPPYLNIKLPDISAPPPEPLIHIPFTPDFWESSRAKAKANPAPPEEPLVPKVIVIAGDTSRADSSQILEPVREHVDLDHHSLDPKVSNLRSLFLDVADDVVLPKDLDVLKVAKNRQGPLDDLIEETTTSVGDSKFHTRTLDKDEVRGVWIILGLFAGSWLAGGLLKKETKYTESSPERSVAQ